MDGSSARSKRAPPNTAMTVRTRTNMRRPMVSPVAQVSNHSLAKLYRIRENAPQHLSRGRDSCRQGRVAVLQQAEHFEQQQVIPLPQLRQSSRALLSVERPELIDVFVDLVLQRELGKEADGSRLLEALLQRAQIERRGRRRTLTGGRVASRGGARLCGRRRRPGRLEPPAPRVFELLSGSAAAGPVGAGGAVADGGVTEPGAGVESGVVPTPCDAACSGSVGAAPGTVGLTCVQPISTRRHGIPAIISGRIWQGPSPIRELISRGTDYVLVPCECGSAGLAAALREPGGSTR